MGICCTVIPTSPVFEAFQNKKEKRKKGGGLGFVPSSCPFSHFPMFLSLMLYLC